MANQTAPASGITISTYGTSTNAAHVVREWISRLEEEAMNSGYFNKFTGDINKYGSAPDAVVMRKTELGRNGGDSLIIPMAMNASPTYVYGDATLLGNETSQALRNLEVKVNQWRAAIAGPAGNADFRIKYLNMLTRLRPDLIRCSSRELDADHFRALCEGFSLNLTTTTASSGLGITKVYHPVIFGVGETYAVNSDATTLDAWVGATGTVSTSDLLDLDALDSIKARCKNGTTISGSGVNRLVPLDLEGGAWYVVLCHPNVIYTLQTANTNAWRTGVEYAAARGKDNPFFTGAMYAYNGMIIHEHPDCPSVLGNGNNTVTFGYKDSNTDVIKCSFVLGRGGLGHAIGQDMKFTPETYDYENQRSLGMAMISGIARADFTHASTSTYKLNQSSRMVVSYGGDPTV